MDAAALEQVYEAFRDFYDYFAPAFGRKQPRELSRHYLQALLVQSRERRNAENLSEAVASSPRVLQRFLTESPWDYDMVIGRLQEYLGPRLGDPAGVWVLDGSDFPVSYKAGWVEAAITGCGDPAWPRSLPGWGKGCPGAHSLRHSVARHWLMIGRVPRDVVSQWLGHANVGLRFSWCGRRTWWSSCSPPLIFCKTVRAGSGFATA